VGFNSANVENTVKKISREQYEALKTGLEEVFMSVTETGE
jgi:hypothetical protein